MTFDVNDFEVDGPLLLEEVRHLMVRERNQEDYAEYSTWAQGMRMQVIGWIEEVAATPYQPYLALTFFDRFANNQQEEVQAMDDAELRLIVDACLSLAEKSLPPEVLLNLADIVSGYTPFEKQVACKQAMELSPVTPFFFLDFFINRLEPLNHNLEISVGRAKHCLKVVLSDVKILLFQPSVVAACAVLHQVIDHPRYLEMRDQVLEGLDYEDEDNLVRRFEQDVDDCFEVIPFE